jgi:hypothetical protein
LSRLLRIRNCRSQCREILLRVITHNLMTLRRKQVFYSVKPTQFSRTGDSLCRSRAACDPATRPRTGLSSGSSGAMNLPQLSKNLRLSSLLIPAVIRASEDSNITSVDASIRGGSPQPVSAAAATTRATSGLQIVSGRWSVVALVLYFGMHRYRKRRVNVRCAPASVRRRAPTRSRSRRR